MAFKRNLKKRGQGAVETLMSMLVFVMMLGTLVSFSLYLFMNHTLFTAAKEGARMASIESRLATAATQAAGIANVRTWVKNFMSGSSGQQLADANITVTGPTGAVVGSRTVTVQVTYTLNNPVAVRGFMAALGGQSATGLDRFNLVSQATMRYEE